MDKQSTTYLWRNQVEPGSDARLWPKHPDIDGIAAKNYIFAQFFVAIQ